MPTRMRTRDMRNPTESSKCLRTITNLQCTVRDPVSPRKSSPCERPGQFLRVGKVSMDARSKIEKDKRIMDWIMGKPMMSDDSGFVTEYMDDSNFFNDEIVDPAISENERHLIHKEQKSTLIRKGLETKPYLKRGGEILRYKLKRNEEIPEDEVKRNEKISEDKVIRNEDILKDEVIRNKDILKDEVIRNEDILKDEVIRNEDCSKGNLKRMSSNEVIGCSSPKYMHVDISNDYLDLLEPSPGYMRQMALDALDWYDKRMGIGKECRKQKVDIVWSLWDKALFGVVKRIFNNLPLKDLHSVSLVCRRWNCVFNEVMRNERLNRIPGMLSRQNRAIRNKENVRKGPNPEKFQFQRPKCILMERQLNVAHPDSIDGLTDRTANVEEFDKSPERVLGRKYTHKPCPMCKRSSLVDLSYHKGKCLYVKCRFVFCSVCKAKYHPFMACLQNAQTQSSEENAETQSSEENVETKGSEDQLLNSACTWCTTLEQ